MPEFLRVPVPLSLPGFPFSLEPLLLLHPIHTVVKFVNPVIPRAFN